MLNNQDFPQLEHKSPVRRWLELVANTNQSAGKESQLSEFDRETKHLQETIVKMRIPAQRDRLFQQYDRSFQIDRDR